jgi:1-acyl-sn-glycerol-3-phosphate acyltransferase
VSVSPPSVLRDRDPAFIRRTLPVWGELATRYFRADVCGLDRVPETGPLLLVGNHSGGNVPPDTFLLTLGHLPLPRAAPVHPARPRPCEVLARSSAPPPLRDGAGQPGEHARRIGRGCSRPCLSRRRLRNAQASWDSGTVDFDHREGFLALAHELDVPIVPVVSIAGQETALFLTRGEHAAHALRLDRAFRLKVLPVSLALPWGLDVGDLLGHLPALPAKVTIHVLEPIDRRALYGPDPDFNAVYDDVVGLMQAELSRLSADRRFPVIG